MRKLSLRSLSHQDYMFIIFPVVSVWVGIRKDNIKAFSNCTVSISMKTWQINSNTFEENENKHNTTEHKRSYEQYFFVCIVYWLFFLQFVHIQFNYIEIWQHFASFCHKVFCFILVVLVFFPSSGKCNRDTDGKIKHVSKTGEALRMPPPTVLFKTSLDIPIKML